MQKYDVALKEILTGGAAGLLSRLMGLEVAGFLNGELPEVRSQRADLLGEAKDGTLFHVELQSTNDSLMALRMLDYLVAIRRGFGRFPRQLVLYVGEAPMKMERLLAASGLAFEFQLIDIRELDGEALLESESLEDNIPSVLARLPDQLQAVRRILAKIAESGPQRRAKALQELTILAGLRGMGSYVEEESRRMPILTDILDHDLLGPIWRKGVAEGRVEGRVEGRTEGERRLLLRQLERRFGVLPEWANDRIGSMSVDELEELGVRFVDVQSIEELFGAR